MRRFRFLAPGVLFMIAALSACRGAPANGDAVSTPGSPEPLADPTTVALEETLEVRETLSARATPTIAELTFPPAEISPALAWRPPPYPVPWSIQAEDHFYLARPIPSGDVNWPHPQFRYGNTYFGEQPIHTGVDLGAEQGTPVLAAGSGEVVWSGYGLYRGVYDLTDPYGLAVDIRHDFGYQGQQLYTVYAHLEKVYVWEGQTVEMGEVLGTVGSTGHSDGPHLHFEVRLGENRYFSTRNPELWMVPPEGWAVFAGLILDTYGRLLPEQMVQIRSITTGERWDVWTYAKETIHPDEYYGENFVISDLPAGPYEVRVDFVGRAFTMQTYLNAGQTNFVTFRGRHGFIPEATPMSPDLSRPPY
jgi:murein DD-endopeptidase MepM/ murein hydrolase activator NlpD